MNKILFIFLDGVGIGEKKSSNPFYQKELFLTDILDTLNKEDFFLKDGISAKKIDVVGKVDEIPQSATNQSTIFTGVDCVKYYGGHKSGFPDKKLKEILKKESIFKKLKNLNIPSFFANAFTPEYFAGKRKRLSVTTLSAIYGGINFRSIFEIPDKKTLFHDFTNISLNIYGYNFPIFDTITASKVLINISKDFNFTLYEFFLTDIAGHHQDMELATTILEILDAFLFNVFKLAKRNDITLLITSDHGNIEDLSLKHHTKNFVPLILTGKGKEMIEDIDALWDITPSILKFLKN